MASHRWLLDSSHDLTFLKQHWVKAQTSSFAAVNHWYGKWHRISCHLWCDERNTGSGDSFREPTGISYHQKRNICYDLQEVLAEQSCYLISSLQVEGLGSADKVVGSGVRNDIRVSKFYFECEVVTHQGCSTSSVCGSRICTVANWDWFSS